MTDPTFNVGALVLGAPTSPRALRQHAELLAACADGNIDDPREAYLSHFVFGNAMRAHYREHRQSVAGYAGPCWCRWLVLDLDRPDLADAVADARRLAACITDRYGHEPAVYFSGSKGFHILIDLAHNPPPSLTFHRVARAFAESIAARAGVTIDSSIYDIAHLVRLPNTRHPTSGLFKRRIDSEALQRLSVEGIRDLARNPSADGLGPPWSSVPQLVEDWAEAERSTHAAAEARTTARRERAGPDARAPRYFLDLMRFGVEHGERHATLFRCAAWLAEQGVPPPTCHALLFEAGCDVGLSPNDVTRQIGCGIRHAMRQRGETTAEPTPDLNEPMPDLNDYEASERWCIQHENDPLPPGATDFPFGSSQSGPYGASGGRL